jgi:hypothetical protein
MAKAVETGDLTLARTVQELRADQVVIPLPERQITITQRLKQLGGKMLIGLIGSKEHQAQVFEFPKTE